AQVSSDHERYPADVKCLGFLYLYVGRYPRNNASRNTLQGHNRSATSKTRISKQLLTGYLSCFRRLPLKVYLVIREDP
ncbi:MAG: hypothetical protein BECKG1743F_GA0114225_100341, partial [Candidatus Kentron sp. G]